MKGHEPTQVERAISAFGCRHVWRYSGTLLERQKDEFRCEKCGVTKRVARKVG